MPKQKQLHITPTPELEFIINEIAKKETISLSAVARRGLIERFSSELAKVEELKKTGKLKIMDGKIILINLENPHVLS